AALRQVVLGQEAPTRDVVVCLLARGHALLEGVPGTAKTLLVRTLALALNVKFQRIQFTPDLMPADITGISMLTGTQEFRFRPGPIFADLVLADEINRAPAKTQAALLEAMQERTVTADGVPHPLSAAFTVFATQNPIEFEGTYPLPEAELDRFMIKALFGYPPAAVEQGILTRYVEGFEADRTETYGVSPVTDAAGLERLRKAVDAVRVEPKITAYITAIVRATRDAASLTLGASPRAGVSLLKAARACRVGHPGEVAYRWRTGAARAARLSVREVRAGLLGGTQPPRDLRLSGGGALRERLPVVPVRRGRETAGSFVVDSNGPLGLGRRRASLSLPWPVIVYPPLVPMRLRASVAQALKRLELGRQPFRRLGEGRLFESLREWVPGDDLRHIDWKATARRRKVITRQYEAERRQHVLLVLDAGRLMTADVAGVARLEYVVQAALELAH